MSTSSIPEEILRVRPVIVVCVMLSTIMQALDTTIANVALPYMQGSLSATQDQINWVLTSYIVAAAIMTLPVGFLAARFGSKKMLLISVAGFTAASILCGIATSITDIVLYRLIQGVFGAALVPLSQAIMLNIYEPAERGPAMAMWGMGVMLGPILGPTLGGWLTETYNWRFVFFVNLPFGILAFVGLLYAMPGQKQGAAQKFDWFGFLMLAAAIGGLQMMLDRGEQLNWFESPEIIFEAAIAVIGLYAFVVHSLTTDKPFIDPAMFTDRNMASSLLFMFAVGVVLLATMALITPYLQNLMHYPVMTAGLVLGPRGLGTMFAMMIAGRLVKRVDPRMLMLTGLLVIAFALHLMSDFTPDVTARDFVVTGVIQGMGLGLVFTPLQTVAFATLPARLRTDGAAMLALVRNIGSSIGISVVIFLLSQNTTIMHAELSRLITPFSPGVLALQPGSPLDPTTATGRALLDQQVTVQSTIIAFANDFRLMTFVALAAIPLLFLMRAPGQQAGAGAGHAVID